MGPMDRTPSADARDPEERRPAGRPASRDGSGARPEAAAPVAPRVRREPRIVPGAGRIRRETLDPAAVHVVERLQQMGHEAYLVGGCVRDLLLGLEPKDFDVATDAPPNRIKRLFRSAFVIGRRFRLVHVRFPDGRVVETATFRADPGEQVAHPDRAEGQIYDDNVFGDAEQDAFRRDFTVNALFYDPTKDHVVDYVGGLGDLETRTLRAIGDPERRLREDPVRMIRAVHFAARLGGRMEPSLEAAVGRCAPEIGKASRSRLYVELMKILGRGSARPTLQRLYELGVLAPWLPELVEFFDRPIEWPREGGGSHESAREGEPEGVPGSHLTWNLLGAADAWGLAPRGVPESLQMAVLCGPWLLDTWERGPRKAHEFGFHVEEAFRPLALRMSIPRRVSYELREILWMLARLKQGPEPARRARGLVERSIFPEALAYYGLELRARDHDLAPVERWREVADEVWASHRDRRPERAPFAEGDSEGGGEGRFPPTAPSEAVWGAETSSDVDADAGSGSSTGPEGDAEPFGRRRRRRGGRGRRGGRAEGEGPPEPRRDEAMAPEPPAEAPRAPQPARAAPPPPERQPEPRALAPVAPPPAMRPPVAAVPAAPPSPPRPAAERATAPTPAPVSRPAAPELAERPFGAGLA